MKSKFFTGDKINDLIIECANFVVEKKLAEYHVFTFKRLSCTELNPRFALVVWYAPASKVGTGE